MAEHSAALLKVAAGGSVFIAASCSVCTEVSNIKLKFTVT